MHPHGVKYNPEYDGAYMGEYTRAGGFIAPGESFTYQWECTPESVGAWPYHDHGPNHTLNTFRGLFGAIIVRAARREGARPRLHAVRCTSCRRRSPAWTRNFHCINGRAYAGNTPTLTARVGQDVEIHVFGMDSNFHTFHIHGHRWKDPAGAFIDNPAVGPERDRHGPLRRGQPGPLALPLPRLLPSGRGDGGLVRRRPLDTREERSCASLLAAVAAAALLAPAAASAQTYPEPKEPGPGRSPSPRARTRRYTVCKKKGRCDFTTIQKAVDKAKAGDTIRVRNGTYREAVKVNGTKKRYLQLIGNRQAPEEGRCCAPAGNMQNGIFVNGADEVTVDGFMARDYKANGFFFTNLTGYTMNHLIARHTGVYGLYAFNTIGGAMLNSEAYYANDGAFYIGQTPPQAKPIRSIVAQRRRLGQPARLQRHQHALRDDHQEPLLQQRGSASSPTRWTREKFPPRRGQRDHRQRHLLEQLQLPRRATRRSRSARTAPRRSCPVGTGVLLLGGRGNRIENNRIYGNYLAGVAAIEGILLAEEPGRAAPAAQRRPQQPVRPGRHRHQRPRPAYDGNGTDNCFSTGRRRPRRSRRRLDVRRLRRRRTRSARPRRTRCSASSARAR